MKEVSNIFKDLGDVNRLRIIKMLEVKKMCVCEIAFVLGITQPSVSRHLKKMMRAGIIGSEQNHFWTNYYLRRDNRYVRTLLSTVAGWLNDDPLVKQDRAKARTVDRKHIMV